MTSKEKLSNDDKLSDSEADKVKQFEDANCSV